MNFRHLLELHQLARQLFEAVNQWLCDAGIMMKQGSLVDATIIEAPTPPKTSEESVTPRCIKWYFGMKAHIGVDAKSGLTHSLETRSANEYDLNQEDHLFHGKAECVFADAGYQGAENREELADVKAQWAIAMPLASSKRSISILVKTKLSLPLRSSSPASVPRWNTRSALSSVSLAL